MKNQVFTTLPSEFGEFAEPRQTSAMGHWIVAALLSFVCVLAGLFFFNDAAETPTGSPRRTSPDAPAVMPRISIPEVPTENKPARRPVQKNAATSKQNLNSVPYSGPRIINEKKVAKLLKQTGFPAHAIPRMVCTAHYESRFDVAAKNENSNGSVDTGLFQINDTRLKSCGVTRKQLRDPKINSSCALHVYKTQGINAWIAYRKKKAKCIVYKVGDFSQVAMN